MGQPGWGDANFGSLGTFWLTHPLLGQTGPALGKHAKEQYEGNEQRERKNSSLLGPSCPMLMKQGAIRARTHTRPGRYESPTAIQTTLVD